MREEGSGRWRRGERVGGNVNRVYVFAHCTEGNSAI